MLRFRGPREDGFTMIATLGVLLVLMLLTAAAAAATLAGTSSSARNTYESRALQAADAAANLALDRLTSLGINSSSTDKCAVAAGTDGSGTLTASGVPQTSGTQTGWCAGVYVPSPGVASQKAGYYVSKWTQSVSGQVTTSTRTIVGYATVGSTTRRVTLNATSTATQPSGTSLFNGYGVTAHQDVTLTNGYYISGAGLRTDGSITLNTTSPPSSVNNCHVYNGNITPGVGKTVTYVNNAKTASQCGGVDTPATSALPTPPAITLPSSNDDAGITSSTDATWNSSAKTLTTQNSGAITLTGNTYVFCSLIMSNGTVTFNPTNKTKPVKVYFPNPGTNGCASGVSPQLSIQNQSVITNSTTQGAAGLQFFMSGSGTLSPNGTTPATSIDINNNSASGQVLATIYAPYSLVQIRNQAGVQGAVYGNQVTFGGNAPDVFWDGTASTVTNGAGGTATYSAYSPAANSYKECNSTTLTSSVVPNNGC